MSERGEAAAGGLEWAAEQDRLEQRGAWIWLLLLVPPLISAATRGLWAPDEPRYAEVARELVERDSWWVLHRCGELYPDKPPFVYWLAALGGLLGGWSELALRLPCWLATAALAWLTRAFALRWFAPREAALAPALLLSFALVADIGGRLQLDPVFALFGALALFLLSMPLPGKRGALGLCLLAGLCTAGALWTKGPAVLVNCGLPLALWLALARDERMAIARAGLRGWAAFAAGLAPLAALVARSIHEEPALGRQWFFRQNVARVTSTGQHWGPPGEPIWELPLWVFPWGAALALGLALAWRAWRERRARPVSSQGLLQAALWFASLLVFYALIPPKRPLYLLPAYPAAALLCAHALAQAERARRLPTWVAWTGPLLLVLLGALLGLAPFALAALPRLRAGIELDADALLAARVLPAAAVLVLGGCLALALLPRRGVAAWVHAQLASWGLALALIAWLVYPLVDGAKSARSLAEFAAGLGKHPTRVPCLGVQPEGYRFYGRFPAIEGTRAELESALGEQPGEFLALVRDREFEAFAPELRARLEVAREQQVGSRRIFVLVARAP